jgi:hypothetical protein
MQYIADADLILEAILNRPKFSPLAIEFWKHTENDKKDEIYITSIGLDRISTLVKLFAEHEEDANHVIGLVTSNFQVIDVDVDILQEARRIDLVSLDLESAIEIVCSIDYNLDGIVTDRQNSFQHTDPLSKISVLYQKTLYDPSSLPSGKKLKTIHEDFPEIKELVEIKESVLPPLKIVGIYIDLAKKYGGEDWGNYYEKYDVIEKEWGNFQEVLTYCWQQARLSKEEYYLKFIELWNLLNRFSDLYSHSKDRIIWLDRIIELSQENEKWIDYFSALTSKVWTLIVRNKLDQAWITLNDAAKVLTLIEKPSLIFRYYHCLCIYHTRKGELNEATEILVKQRYLFGVMAEQEIEEKLITRYNINSTRNSAKIDHEEGLKISDKGRISDVRRLLNSAENKILSCLELAKDIDWQRGVCYLYNKLANINLDLANKVDDLEEKQKLVKKAEKYLRLGEPISILHQRNLRRVTGYYLAFARLEDMKSYLGIGEIPSTFPEKSADFLTPAEKKAQKAIEISQTDGNNRRIEQVEIFFPGLSKKLDNLNPLSGCATLSDTLPPAPSKRSSPRRHM